MMGVRVIALVVSMGLCVPAPGRAQGPDEIAKLRAEIDLLKRENAALRKENEALKQQAAKEAATDPFVQGAVWSGKAFKLPKEADGTHWQLTITARKGTTMEGEVMFFVGNEVMRFAVEGTATNKKEGPVVFTTEKKGFAQLRFQGRLSGGEVALEYGGKKSDGTAAAGIANLKPRN